MIAPSMADCQIAVGQPVTQDCRADPRAHHSPGVGSSIRTRTAFSLKPEFGGRKTGAR
jgi:hypothetical protein